MNRLPVRCHQRQPQRRPGRWQPARLDPETNQGLVTDVCLKRKLRNYVALEQEGAPGYAIYMQEKSVLNNQHKQAYEALGIESEARSCQDEAKARELTGWMCKNFDVRAFGAVMTRSQCRSGTRADPAGFRHLHRPGAADGNFHHPDGGDQ